jgi:hypothetical protein
MSAFHQSEGGFVCGLYEGREAVIPLPEIGTLAALAELYENVGFAGETTVSAGQG